MKNIDVYDGGRRAHERTNERASVRACVRACVHMRCVSGWMDGPTHPSSLDFFLSFNYSYFCVLLVETTAAAAAACDHLVRLGWKLDK